MTPLWLDPEESGGVRQTSVSCTRNATFTPPPPSPLLGRLWEPAFREKGVTFWAQKTAGGSLGTSHLAFREKGGVWGAQKTAGGSLGTSHLAFLTKIRIFYTYIVIPDK